MQTISFREDAAHWESFVGLDAAERRGALAAYRHTLPAFDRYGARRHFLLQGTHGAAARVTASVHPALRGPDGAPLGLLGHLATPDEPAALRQLLAPALAWLADAGCTRLRAPMTHHTWLPYRLVTEGFGRAPFFGEPHNAAHLPGLLATLGFEVQRRYFSAVTEDLDEQAQRTGARGSDLLEAGFRLRCLDPSRAADELDVLHGLALRCFAANFSYAPVDREEFGRLYGPALRMVDPHLVLIAHAPDEAPVAFLFGLRDPGDPSGRTAIIKTLGVAPEHQGTGLGSLMVAALHRAAAALGCTRMIHALMPAEGPSRAISERGATVFRRYAVVERALRRG